MAPKKGRRSKHFDDDDEDNDSKLDDGSKAETSAAAAPAKKTSKKKQAKKNKKAIGDWSDDEATTDPEAQEAGDTGTLNGKLEEEDTLQKATKNQATAKANFAALSLKDGDESEEEVAPVVKPKSKGKKKPQSSIFAALEDDADDPELDAEAEAEADEGQEDAAEMEQPVCQEKTSSFGLLETEDEPADVADAEDVAVEDVQADLPAKGSKQKGGPDKKGRKGKAKGKGKDNFDLALEDEFPALDPQVATILSVEPHPNADKLKICSVETASGSFKVVTNASTAREGLKVVYAGVGCTLPGSGQKIERVELRGVESWGMLCSAYDVGWSSEPDGVLIELPESLVEGESITSQPVKGAKYGTHAATDHVAQNGQVHNEEEQPSQASSKKTKGKKKKTGADAMAAAFAALELEQPEGDSVTTEQVPEPSSHDPTMQDAVKESEEPQPEKKKGKKKAKAFDMDAALLAATGEAANGAEEVQEEPVEKKKKGKKRADFDVDAMLAEATGEAAAPAETMSTSAIAPEEAPQESVKEAGKKKGKEEKEEDIDALLAEFGVDTKAAEEKKSKKKKKGKAALTEEAEPSQAAARNLSQPSTSGATEMKQEAEQGARQSAAAEPQAEDEAEAGEDEDEAEEGKELTAAQRKKLKKKAKEKAKKAEGGDKEGAGKKGPAKKESAAVRKLREDLERQKAEQEAAKKAEEERIRQEEEAALRAEEEAKRREEEKKRRKEDKAKERAELKRKGLLLTGKEKAEAERLAAIREQLLKDNPDLPAAGQHKKKPMYSKKKGPSKMKQDDTAAAEAKQQEEEEKARQEAEAVQLQKEQEEKEREEAARKQAEAEAAAAAAQQEAEESDDIGWDELDVEQIKLPGQESEAEEEEEEEEEEAEPEVKEEVASKRPADSQRTSVTSKEALPNGTRRAAPPAEAQPQVAKKQKTAEPIAKQPEPAESSEEGEEDEEESEEEEEETSEEESSEEESSSEYSDSDETTDSEEAREERIRQARAVRAERLAAAKQAGKADDLSSYAGKTKLLDNIRRTSVQEGEAGGITQQIGATYVPGDSIRTRTEPVRKGREFGLKVPGLLIIDTPGHESFTNLRSRGSSLCDIAILVVDIMHGLEPQTIESINLLKQKKTPFIVALNKVDRLFEWKSVANAAIQDSLGQQASHVVGEYEKNLQRAILNLNEQGLNVALYWKNPDPRKYVNIVPTSAITGEGIPDMLQLVVQLTQKMMAERLMFISELQCTVLEVKVIEGLGTTVDVVLVNGVLREGDQIVLCGLQGPIVTTIRSLLTPHPLKELRVRGSYLHHKEVKAAQGIKIAAQNLENAVAGTQMLVVQKGDSVEDLKEEVMGDMTDIFKSVDKSGEGVCVQASTLGSLEALLEFLRSDAVKIPVSGINIGPVHKRDVMRASTMLEKGRKKYAVILAFDVIVTKEAQEQATSAGVRIFTADIIYHLFDQFSAYLKHTKEEEQQAASADAVFPVILQIMENCIFNAKDPIVLGCTIEEGIAKVGTPLCVPSRGGFMLGRIASMELNHKPVDKAVRGDAVALKIESSSTEESSRLYGRHFDFRDRLVSRISRRSIDLLKLHFKDALERDDWRLVVKLKKMFGID